MTPVQAAGAAWYDGLSQYSTITNCASILQGSPCTERGDKDGTATCDIGAYEYAGKGP